jgi:hypothetical protein
MERPESSGTKSRERFFRLWPLDVDLGDVVVQIVAVALGVILGFAATAWNERQHQQALLRETAGNIFAELSANQTGLRVVMAEHAKEAATLSKLVTGAGASTTISLADGRKALRATGVFRANVPLAIAWQIAQNDQGLTLFPYQDRYDLAWIYQVQSIYYGKEEQYENTLLNLSESPSGNYFFLVANASNQLQSIVAIEHQLDDLYTKALKQAKTEFKL